MVQIYSNGTGGGNYTDTSTWSGGVVPYQANGDTSLILNGDSILDSIPMGEVCEQNLGYIQINYGIIFINDGTIYDNSGYTYVNNSTINRGIGTVYENYGTIDWLESGGQISYGNYQGSTVTTNDGYIPYNFGFINNHNGQVDWNDQSGYIYYVNGYVNNNYNGAYVEEISLGGTVNFNGSGCSVNVVYGTIDDNYGTANNIAYGGYVGRNYYDIIYNNGIVNINYSYVGQTQSGGIINTNETSGFCLNAPNGICTDNYGYCNNVAGSVTTNYSGGIVDNGDNGAWGGYYGSVGYNAVGGIIRYNFGDAGAGKSYVTQNDGVIDLNYGDVADNTGTGEVNYNESTGVLTYNHGKVYRNDGYVITNNVGGIIHKHDGTCTDNYGEIHIRIGSITTNYTNAIILFSSMSASQIQDVSSGIYYGIASDAFSNPTVSKVELATTYTFNEDLLTGTLVPTTILSGVTITEY